MLSIDLLTDWTALFDAFLDAVQFDKAARSAGLNVKSKHTIVAPWPYNAGPRTTQEEFEELSRAGTVGCERYVELERRGGGF